MYREWIIPQKWKNACHDTGCRKKWQCRSFLILHCNSCISLNAKSLSVTNLRYINVGMFISCHESALQMKGHHSKCFHQAFPLKSEFPIRKTHAVGYITSSSFSLSFLFYFYSCISLHVELYMVVYVTNKLRIWICTVGSCECYWILEYTLDSTYQKIRTSPNLPQTKYPTCSECGSLLSAISLVSE